MILIDPHLCKMVKSSYTESTWKCHYMCAKFRPPTSCPVRLTYCTKTEMILNETGVHSHDSHMAEDTVTDMVKEHVKKAVDNPNVPPRAVLMDITNDVLSNPNTENYVGNLPSAKTLAKNIQRKQKLSLDAPPLPKKWADMIVPENYKLTVNSCQFLFMDEEIPGGKKIWGF